MGFEATLNNDKKIIYFLFLICNKMEHCEFENLLFIYILFLRFCLCAVIKFNIVINIDFL